MQQTIINPFYAARINRTARQPQDEPYKPVYAKLPRAPRNASPVPHLTSPAHFLSWRRRPVTAAIPAIAAAIS